MMSASGPGTTSTTKRPVLSIMGTTAEVGSSSVSDDEIALDGSTEPWRFGCTCAEDSTVAALAVVPDGPEGADRNCDTRSTRPELLVALRGGVMAGLWTAWG